MEVQLLHHQQLLHLEQIQFSQLQLVPLPQVEAVDLVQLQMCLLVALQFKDNLVDPEAVDQVQLVAAVAAALVTKEVILLLKEILEQRVMVLQDKLVLKWVAAAAVLAALDQRVWVLTGPVALEELEQVYQQLLYPLHMEHPDQVLQ
tara:strand:+ start:274 stop:714 length:441 start_codon:yes stop_codon:yes gene_type:complete